MQVGNCGVECKTAERAAERIMGEHDTDVAEVLYAVGGAGSHGRWAARCWHALLPATGALFLMNRRSVALRRLAIGTLCRARRTVPNLLVGCAMS